MCAAMNRTEDGGCQPSQRALEGSDAMTEPRLPRHCCRNFRDSEKVDHHFPLEGTGDKR